MDEKRNEIILFENQGIKLEVNLKDETVWLTQKQMAELFGKDRRTITRHIQNIYKDEELDENSVCSFFEHTAEDGKKYTVQYYNLDMIISVGYRVNSKRGILFRKWSTKVLKDYMLKGANFLYLIVKNHVFADGNKRIAATLFIYFLNFYRILYINGKQTIDNNTLAALTLLIAESNPREKEVIIDLVMNFLNVDEKENV
mgnify:CR=1 FL=1